MSKSINWIIYFIATLFCIANAFFIYKNWYLFSLFPIGLLIIYSVFFKLEKLFLFIVFCTPLSINIEEWTDGLGLYIPTEPILFGIMILFLMHQLRKNQLPNEIWKNPIIIIVLIQLIWLFITSITSSSPLVSFKFLLSRLWFVIPILFLGIQIFTFDKNKIKSFLWLYLIGMFLVMSYTLFMHALNNFSEPSGHWVMWPFFKDHTSYGAILAMIFPIIVGLLFSKKQSLLISFILILFIIAFIIGIYFSYTRAAWLSLLAALGVLILIKLKIKFKYLLIISIFIGLFTFLFWTQIQIELNKNNAEHTTEDISERIQSMTNITTDASNLERLNRWDCAISMFKEKPITGYGPGTYAFEYAKYQHSSNITIISTNFGDGGNAHSEYLGPLAETGMLGFLLMIGLVLAIFYKSIRLYYKLKNKEWKALLLAIICGLVTYFIHGILNNYLDTDKASILVWGFSAAIIALEINLNKNMI